MCRLMQYFLVLLIWNSALTFPMYQKIPSLLDVSIDELGALLITGEITSVELVGASLARIAEVNDELHAVIEVNPDASRDAAFLDSERRAGRVRGPVHGIPILVKDNIATTDKMNTTAGSFCLLGARPVQEATVIEKLREVGAIILGKTNLSQWASIRSSDETFQDAWSARGGQTIGAYVPKQNPGGSSSGSAVAVSVGLSIGALGTETSGSIISPCEKNNLVCIKPTTGLTSRWNVIPVTVRQDTVGPMARSVRDAAYLLSAIAGFDSHDNYTSAQPFSKPLDYVSALNSSSLNGARIGVPRNALPEWGYGPNGERQVWSAFNSSLEVIASLGAAVIDPTPYSYLDVDPQRLNNWHYLNRSITTHADFLSGINGYLSSLVTNPRNLKSLTDLRKCTVTAPEEDWPSHDVHRWDQYLAVNLNSSSSEAWNAWQALQLIGGEGSVLGTLDRYNLDALVLPSFTAFSLPSIIGSPVITVPLGQLGPDTETVVNKWGMVESGPGFPFGLSFFGRKWDEEKLVGYAYAFEQKTRFREKIKPVVVPKTELRERRALAAQGVM